jgi:8-oxo-dGTP pyrophosphatase MutT (NUDIX family)
MADDELLDVVDEHGRHLGVKRRDAVHRDGDWHLAFHLWVVSAEGVLLQRRARTKASWPGRLDATAAGHLLAGETIADGLREAEEELGVRYAFGDLTGLGVHRVDEGTNREQQHVFAVRDDRSLAAWTDYNRAELDGLVLAGHDAFAALATGRAGAPVSVRAWDGRAVAEVRVTAAELVPTPYLPWLADRLRALAP